MRISRLLPALALGAVLAYSVPLANAASAADAVAQAEQDLSSAKKADALWRLIDAATGGSAVSLSKLLKVAKKKLEAGDEAEALRLAERISWASQAGITQAKQQQDAGPIY
ncbi:MAG: hypothetical protein CL394_06765 [Acidiferrobacteraceae bacterium]|nr:hypothetical protein [Acidiferrobacteraceae bacterium]